MFQEYLFFNTLFSLIINAITLKRNKRKNSMNSINAIDPINSTNAINAINAIHFSYLLNQIPNYAILLETNGRSRCQRP